MAGRIGGRERVKLPQGDDQELRALRERVAELESALDDEQARLRDDQRFRIVAEQTGQLVYDYDTRSGHIAWAGAIEPLTGFSDEEFGQINIDAWEQLLHPDDRPDALTALEAAMQSVEAYRVEYRFRRKDGEYIHVEDRGVFLAGADGTAVRMLGTMSDVTQRKELEAQLRHRQKLESLGVLAGGIAHDFNNLLTSILGNADIAKHIVPASAPVHKQLNAIAVASRRAGDLCRQLLAYSGKATFEVGPVDLNELLAETHELLRLSISGRATLDLDLMKDGPVVSGNAAQLRQVVMNLIMNASEALGSDGGCVTVRTGCRHFDADDLVRLHGDIALEPGTYAVLTVADNGCGMDDETQRRIFDPFYSTKFTGRGLGLAAVIGIVGSHDGGVLIDSEPGRGTTFEILLPAAATSRPAPREDSEPTAATGAGTVLVVDDEVALLNVAKAILEAAGYDTVLACDGHEALEQFLAAPNDFVCVLLDLTMPGLSGEEVMERLRAQRDDIPILLCSGYGETTLTTPLNDGSNTGFLQKPYTVPDLQRAIARLAARAN